MQIFHKMLPFWNCFWIYSYFCFVSWWIFYPQKVQWDDLQSWKTFIAQRMAFQRVVSNGTDVFFFNWKDELVWSKSGNSSVFYSLNMYFYLYQTPTGYQNTECPVLSCPVFCLYSSSLYINICIYMPLSPRPHSIFWAPQIYRRLIMWQFSVLLSTRWRIGNNNG